MTVGKNDVPYIENAFRSRSGQAEGHLREALALRHPRLQPDQHLHEMEEIEERGELHEVLIIER